MENRECGMRGGELFLEESGERREESERRREESERRREESERRREESGVRRSIPSLPPDCFSLPLTFLLTPPYLPFNSLLTSS